MPVKPMLGGIELQQVQKIETDEDQVLTQHSVPALEGDFLQGLGRRATRVTLSGVMTGADAGANLKTLRDKYREGVPVSFVADIATATKVKQVFIEELGVRELAGKPGRFEYQMTLREMIPPPPPEFIVPPPPIEPPPPIDPDLGTLVVEVIVEGEPEFDFSTVTVTVEGVGKDSTSLVRTMTNRTNHSWTDANMPLGQFTVRARTGDRSGLANAQILGAQTTQVAITLRSVSNRAKTFLLHFRFDKGFVEPCLRPVLREVATYAEAHTDEKLLILGHTDKVDVPAYNQSLSERRARAVHAFLTFRRDRQAAISEWEALRQRRTTGRGQPTLEDRWDTREYQHILQDLGFYPGKIDGNHGPMTDEAVRAYRCHKGLPPGTQVDNEVWHALIEDYLAQDNFNVPTSQFFPNCGQEIVKWLGAGEEDPVNNTEAPHRPSRRVELLFVRTDRLPCPVPQPDTFALPQPGAVNSDWCIGPHQPGGDHVCFVTKRLDARGQPQPCTASTSGPFCREPADPRTLTLQGSIRDESGALLRNQSFLITTPTGEFLRREGPTGEGIAQTTATGEFSFPDKPAGFYSLEVPRDVLVRNASDGDETIKGNTVCKEIRSDSDHLDVVIVNVPRVREIKLPVVAHLMTARNASGVIHSTIRNEANVRGVFTEVNRIWRPARIRFELVDVVSQTYEPPPPPAPAVSEAEFFFVCANGAFPNVVNVFYVNDVGNSSEAGWSASPESGAQRPGCMIETLDDHLSAVVTAHELGHFLNLHHPEEQPGATGPFSDRLMHGSALVLDTRLIDSEIATARASRGAELECVPLTVHVTGATQVDGLHSPDFIALREDVGGPITVEAVISPGLLALGTLTMTGGDLVPGFPLLRNVSRSNPGLTPVEAVFTRVVVTASGPNTETIRYAVRIIVVNFDLQVNGAQRLGDAGSNIFVAQSQSGGVVEVIASLTPASALPACVINSTVQWQGGREVLGDPFRRTVSKTNASETTVSATVASTTRTAVIRVLDFAFVANTPPFDAVLNQVRWEDAFRIRADVPGETRDEIIIELTSFFVRRT